MKSERETIKSAMAIYVFGISPFLAWLSEKSKETIIILRPKQVVFVDDSNGVGPLENRGNYLKKKKTGYNVKAGKFYLILKDEYNDEAIEIFENSHIKTTKGHRYLDSGIGSK